MMSLVDMCSASLPKDVIGWSVSCVSSSGYHWLDCVLCIFLRMSLVDLYSAPLPQDVIG